MANRFHLRRWIRWLAPLVILFGAAVAWFAFDPGFHPRAVAPTASTDVPQDEFEKRVGAYLLDHPEVIIQAVNRYESKQAAQRETEAQVVLKARAEEVFRDKASPIAGNPTGDATLVEFFDYNCPNRL